MPATTTPPERYGLSRMKSMVNSSGVNVTAEAFA
jgi:hypothetical protein